MHRILSDEALDILFRTARSPEAWLDRPVGETLLRDVWELARLGPVSHKALPVRILFLRSPEAKERLASAFPPQEAAALNAPVTAILAADPTGLAERAPIGAEARAQAAADGALRGACLILAARALGLDCCPIWDFDAGALERAFFPEGGGIPIFLCALGYGDKAHLDDPPRPVVEVCRFL
jgi:3-hydroxypropanoate dehydrogenase